MACSRLSKATALLFRVMPLFYGSQGLADGANVHSQRAPVALAPVKDLQAAVKKAQEELTAGKKVLEGFAESISDYGPVLVEILKGMTVQAEGGTLKVRTEVGGETIEKALKKPH